MTEPRIEREHLVDWGVQMYLAVGCSEHDARVIAGYQVEADERGHPSHGIDQLPAYARGFLGGHLNPRPEVSLVSHRGAMAAYDGDNGLGHVVADVAMDHAIELAREHAVGIVTTRRSNHFGMAGHWPLKAVRAGMIGFTTTNGPPVMAPWGGRVGSICNNPFSWGIPTGSEPTILLDMALTAGARGKVRLANQQGQPIPEGWALGPDGQPTTDAQTALDGVMLPLGGPKGSGIAVVNEVLASALSGSLFLTQITNITMASTGVHASWQIGHLFMVIDPSALRPLDEFTAHVDAIITTLREVPVAAGADRVRVPGERAAERVAEAAARGVPLAPQSIEKLSAYGDELGVAFPRHQLKATS